jgi:hypothetical protein
MKLSFYKFASSSSEPWGDSPTAAPVAVTATLTLTLTSSLTAAQITASASIQTALKSAIAVMLEVDVSSVTGVTATAVARKKRTAAEAQRELDAGIIAIDWREHQAEDATRILGHGLQVISNGLVVKRINDLVWRKMAVSAVTITASVTSAYSSSALTAAQNAYSSVFQSAFTTAAASYGIIVNEPTLTPTAAPTPTPTAAPTPTPTAVTASTASTASSSTTLIIGVVVGVGGAIFIAGGIYAAIASSNGAANSKMPVESSAHHKSGTGEDYSGGEVEVLAISHGDHHGTIDAESDTWQTVKTSEHRPHAHPHNHI